MEKIEEKISDVEMVVRTILYSPVTNNRDKDSIANGIKLIERLLTTRNDEVVKMVEEMIGDLDCVSIQSAFREFNDHAILQLKDLLTKLKEDNK